MKNKLILNKPNQVIEISGDIELTELKILSYNYILHKMQQEKTNVYTFSGAEIFNAIGLSKNYDEIVNYFDTLNKVRIVSKDKKGKTWGAFYLVSSFCKLENGLFKVEIPTLIFESLCQKEELYYTTINLLEQRVLKNPYSMILYEIFKKFEGINIKKYGLEELKEILNVKNKYEKYKDFKRYVLNKSLKEINLINKYYEYSFEEEKEGRRVSKIQFKRSKKINEDIKEKIYPVKKKIVCGEKELNEYLKVEEKKAHVINLVEVEKIKITVEEYERLYLKYLEDNKVNNNPYMKRTFDLANANKYVIID